MSTITTALDVANGKILGLVLAAADDKKSSSGGFTFSLSPDSSAPGVSGLQSAINAGATYALLACLAGFVGGAIATGGGSWLQNDMIAQRGRTGMFWSLAGAFLVAIATALFTFAYGLG